jgi:hypothetical protein
VWGVMRGAGSLCGGSGLRGSPQPQGELAPYGRSAGHVFGLNDIWFRYWAAEWDREAPEDLRHSKGGGVSPGHQEG